MARLRTSIATLIALATIGWGGPGDASAGVVQGKVVLCTDLMNASVDCPPRRIRSTIDVVAIRVDGSVSRRHITTDRAGRFRISLAPGYYVFAARVHEPGLSSMPVEITVSSETSSITLIQSWIR